MRADELMIGDWVFYAGEEERFKNKPIRVTGIGPDCMQGSFRNGVSDEVVVLSYKEIEPIPIDLDILEKNGWKGGAGRNIRFKSPYILAKKNDVWIMYYSEARIVEILYVHELQNILRMLGCEEGSRYDEAGIR